MLDLRGGDQGSITVPERCTSGICRAAAAIDAEQRRRLAAAAIEAAEERGRLHGLLRARHGELEARASESRRLQVGLRLVETYAPGVCGELFVHWECCLRALACVRSSRLRPDVGGAMLRRLQCCSAARGLGFRARLCSSSCALPRAP